MVETQHIAGLVSNCRAAIRSSAIGVSTALILVWCSSAFAQFENWTPYDIANEMLYQDRLARQIGIQDLPAAHQNDDRLSQELADLVRLCVKWYVEAQKQTQKIRESRSSYFASISESQPQGDPAKLVELQRLLIGKDLYYLILHTPYGTEASLLPLAAQIDGGIRSPAAVAWERVVVRVREELGADNQGTQDWRGRRQNVELALSVDPVVIAKALIAALPHYATYSALRDWVEYRDAGQLDALYGNSIGMLVHNAMVFGKGRTLDDARNQVRAMTELYGTKSLRRAANRIASAELSKGGLLKKTDEFRGVAPVLTVAEWLGTRTSRGTLVYAYHLDTIQQGKRNAAADYRRTADKVRALIKVCGEEEPLKKAERLRRSIDGDFEELAERVWGLREEVEEMYQAKQSDMSGGEHATGYVEVTADEDVTDQITGKFSDLAFDQVPYVYGGLIASDEKRFAMNVHISGAPAVLILDGTSGEILQTVRYPGELRGTQLDVASPKNATIDAIALRNNHLVITSRNYVRKKRGRNLVSGSVITIDLNEPTIGHRILPDAPRDERLGQTVAVSGDYIYATTSAGKSGGTVYGFRSNGTAKYHEYSRRYIDKKYSYGWSLFGTPDRYYVGATARVVNPDARYNDWRRSGPGYVDVFDVGGRTPTATLTAGSDPSFGQSLAADSEILLVGGAMSATVFNTRTLEKLGELESNAPFDPLESNGPPPVGKLVGVSKHVLIATSHAGVHLFDRQTLAAGPVRVVRDQGNLEPLAIATTSDTALVLFSNRKRLPVTKIALLKLSPLSLSASRGKSAANQTRDINTGPIFSFDPELDDVVKHEPQAAIYPSAGGRESSATATSSKWLMLVVGIAAATLGPFAIWWKRRSRDRLLRPVSVRKRAP